MGLIWGDFRDSDAGITLANIDSFWAEKPFRLDLPTVNGKTLLGNCDLCFLKGRQQTYSIIQSDLRSADWWARMETLVESGGRAVTFRRDRPSYAETQVYARQQSILFGEGVDDQISCFYGD